MPSEHSVTELLDKVRGGDEAAARELWERYFADLVRIARRKMQGARRRVADEEDAALHAMDSFIRGVHDGKFPGLRDRHGVWPLLVAITAHKACRLMRDERRHDAGGESVFPQGLGMRDVLGRDANPALAAQVAEECQRLLAELPDALLRQIVLWKLEGLTNKQIASKIGRVETTVERKLQVIRAIWEKATRGTA